MKYLISVVLVLISSLALVGCAKKNPLVPSTPWADIANDSLCFFTVSTDPEGLKVCYVFDWGDGNTTTTGFAPSGDTGWCSHEFAGTAVHYIKVKARNEKGAESGWSPSLTFHPSQPPQLVDTIVGLRRWAVDRWYHASVRATDPDADSVAVRFVWGDLPAAGWSAFVPSGSVVTDSCKWAAIGPHTVRVVLRDKGCAVCRPGEVKTVSVSTMAIIWSNYDEDHYYDATPTLGTIDGEPVLYCPADDGIDCYTMEGRLRWSAPIFEEEDYAASLNADGSRLYLTDYAAGLVCLDTRTGQTKWSLLQSAPSGTPALGPDGAIYVTAFDGDGELDRVRDCGDSAVVEWRLPLGPSMVDGAVVGRNGVAYALGYDSHTGHYVLFAADPAGTVLWKDSARIESGGSPVIDGRDRILVTDEYGYLYCFNPDGTLAWSESVSDPCAGATAVGRDDEVVVTDYAGRIIGYDSTGRQQWSSTPAYFGATNTPCVAQDSTIIAYDPDGGCVYGIGIDGQTLWEFSIWDSIDYEKQPARRAEGDYCPSAVIGPNGDLYLASGDGLLRLACAGLRMAATAWPTYNHDAARSGWAGRP
jgi:hypothetical protein